MTFFFLWSTYNFIDSLFTCTPMTLLSPAGRAGDYKTHSVRVCVSACVRVLLSVCHAFIKGCTSHWLFLLGLFNVFDDLIAYVLSFDAVISHLGP